MIGLGIGAVAAGAAAVVGYGTFMPRGQLWGPVVWRGREGAGKKIALTFDDGPWPGGTDAMLVALAELEVKAVFFVIGVNVERWPDLARRIVVEGHIVGNHSYDHSHTGFLHGRTYWLDQMTRTDAAIEKVVGKRSRLFRPPLGFKCRGMARAAKERGMDVVTWSRRAFDGAPVTAQTILRRLSGRCRGGDIVTLHDGFEPQGNRLLNSTVEAIRPLVRGLREQGLTPVRLDELTGLEPYKAE